MTVALERKAAISMRFFRTQ